MSNPAIQLQFKAKVVLELLRRDTGYSKYWNNSSAAAELPIVQINQLLTLTQAAHEQKQT